MKGTILPVVAAGMLAASVALAESTDRFMGEYAGKYASAAGGRAEATAKVVPEGDGAYRAILLAGTTRIELKGRTEGSRVFLGDAQGWSATITGGALTASAGAGGGESFLLKQVERRSPTLGMKPPRGAIVLLPLARGTPFLAEWDNAGWKILPGGVMEAGNGDNRTRRSFGDIELHVEFRIPYQPGTERDRGNSGVYLQDRYEIQVLETFGLDPDPGVCGAVYQVAAPKVNATLPMLAWQTYDITFRAPRLTPDGTLARPALISVRHNGIPIHDAVEVANQTGGGAEGAVPAAPIKLQDHGHPVQYRNVWVVELKDGQTR
jgi:hypothetical protein